jgi:hypothetical protein
MSDHEIATLRRALLGSSLQVTAHPSEINENLDEKDADK